jgi:hypothetical protein
MNEYVGCKLERNTMEGWIKFAQTVLLQSYTNEFELPEGTATTTPADNGQILVPCDPVDGMPKEKQSSFRTGVGKLLHMMRWSCPDVLNHVQELSHHMEVAAPVHLKSMLRVLKYCVSTPDRGLTLKPNRTSDGKKDFEFIVKGLSDANYAADPSSGQSVSGYSVFLENAPISMKSKQQKSVMLSTAEAELVSGMQYAQDMLFIMGVLESIRLKVKKPMVLQIDNKGAVDLANNWSIGGRTRHIVVHQYFLQDLKMDGVILTQWLIGSEMSSDLFMKNLPRPLFEQHTKTYCGQDKYMKDYMTLKGRVSQCVIESNGKNMTKYVSHKIPFVTQRHGEQMDGIS